MEYFKKGVGIMEDWNVMREFWEYIEFYPCEDEEGYDNIHNGGIKGIRHDAPETAKAAYERWIENKKKNNESDIKI